MLTKTQIRIMQVFAADIPAAFSIKAVADLLKKPYPLIHRAAAALIAENLLKRDEHGLVSINYKANHQEIAYVEATRLAEFLKRHKTVKLFGEDALKRLRLDYFTLLVFGSYAKASQGRNSDVDVLLIVEKEEDVDKAEKVLNNVASNFSAVFHCSAISKRSVYEMLAKREEKNVINETLRSHIIHFGAENYYRMIANAR